MPIVFICYLYDCFRIYKSIKIQNESPEDKKKREDLEKFK